MDRQQFLRSVEEHPDLSLIAERELSVQVHNTRLDAAFDVPHNSIAQHSWQNLSRVLCGGEDRVISKMTRVVGYFSKTHNWNESKLGELADRHAGDYAIGKQV